MRLTASTHITISWNSTTILVEHCHLQPKGFLMGESLTGIATNMLRW